MDLSWLLGHAHTTFTHHPQPVTLQSSDGDQNLLEVCKLSTPPCHLNPLLFNGHLQTIWTAVKPADIPIYYKRHIFQAAEPEYGGTFAVDFVVPQYDGVDVELPPRTTYYTKDEFTELGTDDTKPMVIVLHGLSGGSYEIYLRSVLKLLVEAGWEACVVNSRGCAKSTITTPMLYNARATWDVRQVAKWARQTWPNRKLFGIGFSLGANILTNYLGEEGDKCLLSAAVVCSNPWNLEVSSVALQRTWLGLEVYSKTMGTNMKALFETHAEQISKSTRINLERIRNIRYLHEFDRALQGPTWGYPTEGAYYRDASSCDSLHAIRIPLLAINALDDPIAHKEAIPWQEFEQNPYTILCTTSLGGHLSWFETGGARWFAKPASQFLVKMAADFEIKNSRIGLGSSADKEAKIVIGRSNFKPMRRRLHMSMDP